MLLATGGAVSLEPLNPSFRLIKVGEGTYRVDEEGVNPHEQERFKGIGGSDAAAIVGVSPFSQATRLNVWMEKTRHPQFTRKTETPAMRWGKLIEPIAASEYARTHHVDVTETPGRIWHPNGVQNANPDRFVWEGGLLAGLWEGKTANDPDEWAEGVPEYYLPQVQQYLAVTEMPWCDVSVLLPGGDFRTYRVDSDLGYQIELEERVVDFWERYVLTGVIPPEGADQPDLLFPRQFEPESRLTVAVDTALDDLIKTLLLTRKERIEAEFEEAALISRAKMIVGEHAGADGDEWTVHWRQSKPTTKVGWEHVATLLWNTLAMVRRMYPDWRDGPAAKYLTSDLFATALSLYTVQGPAVRPFLVKRKEGTS